MEAGSKFQCECGVEVEQTRRGRKRTKCAECQKSAKRNYCKAYYQAHKAKPQEVPFE